ncbi:MAG: hypothetical protein DHS20C02_10210 [Micavibrio sp.]|nr:MAG: hypothetical protein DHS20C02_10210 [Micavibrio sp.]
MQYMVIARDGNDEGALERRMAAREDHIKVGDEYLKSGNFLMAVALLNDDQEMIGSVMLVDFEGREELDAWLEVEPYVTGGVWKHVEFFPAKVGPSFEQFLPNKKQTA